MNLIQPYLTTWCSQPYAIIPLVIKPQGTNKINILVVFKNLEAAMDAYIYCMNSPSKNELKVLENIKRVIQLNELVWLQKQGNVDNTEEVMEDVQCRTYRMT